jgi:predicted PurR-regulated permease PerM
VQLSARLIAKVILVSVAVLVVLYLLYLVRSIIGLLLIAVFLAVALGPAVDLYQQRARVPRGVAILAVYLTILGAIFGLGLLVVPPIVRGVNNFVDAVPGYVQDLRKNETLRKYDDKYHVTEKLDEQARKLPTRLGDAAGALKSVTVGVFSALFQLVTVLVLTFFMLKDGKRAIEWLLRELGPERGPRMRAVCGDVYNAVGGYVVGNVIISVIAGTGTYIVLTILDVPYAVPLAVLMAFLDLIPLVGATIGGVAIGVVAAIADFPTALIVWAIYFIVYQQIENNLLQPVIYRRTVSLHPLIVLVAVLIGGSQLGVLGALLAIPVAAAVQIVVRDWWRERKLRFAVTGADQDRPPPEVAPETP